MSVHRVLVLRSIFPDEILAIIHALLKKSFGESIRDLERVLRHSLNDKYLCFYKTTRIVYDQAIAESMFAGDLGAKISRFDFVEIQNVRRRIWRDRVTPIYIMYSRCVDNEKIKWIKHF